MKKTMAVIGWLAVWFMTVPVVWAVAGVLDIEVLPDQGASFRLIPHKEFNSGNTYVYKRYLEARKGEHYTILLRNYGAERLGVVIAVDGRNIITGRKSYLGSSEMMYIVEPYATSRLEGWRTGDNTVNRFYFTSTVDSYAARTFGDVSAMGVIAAAVYRERYHPEVLHESRSAGKAAAPSAAPRREKSAAAEDSAGTGFGREQYSPVVKVEFEPDTYPAEKYLIKYEWREELCRKGIISCRHEGRNRLWDNDGYAPYPPTYPSW